jgi:hypothetical protein
VSLGLPEFGSHRSAEKASGVFRLIQVLGFVALAYALVSAALLGRAAYSADRARERVLAVAALDTERTDAAKKTLRRNQALLVAAASVESPPERVLRDLDAVRPEGVSILGLKVDYTSDAVARAEFVVAARDPEAYDRFLGALSKSAYFTDIKPGSESRPGLVRATVIAIHRAQERAR